VHGDALIIGHDKFSQSEILLPKVGEAIGKVGLVLAPDSGPLKVQFSTTDPSPGPRPMVVLGPASYSLQSQDGTGGPHWSLTWKDDGVLLTTPAGDLLLEGAASAQFELSAATKDPVRIQQIHVVGKTGTPLISENPATPLTPLPLLAAGAALGLLLGLSLLLGPSQPILVLLCWAAPVALLAADGAFWVTLADRLYLGNLAPTHLARQLLVVSLVPPAFLLILASGLLELPVRRASPPAARWAWALWAAAAWPASSGSGLATVLLAGFLVSPGLWAHRARLPHVSVLVRDLPALALLVALGWKGGLAAAGAWRIGVLVANRKRLLQRAPRASADALFVWVLALPLGLEGIARSGVLEDAWNPERLGRNSVDAQLTPYWGDRCGPGETSPVRLTFLGGSSAGGAYQFSKEPAAFFPALLHRALCERFPEQAFEITNLAQGGRNSYSFSRHAETILGMDPPDLVVAYLGVNEYTQNQPLTRKELEANLASPARRELGRWARRSRLLVGASLVARPAESTGGKRVSEVPPADFEENLRLLHKALGSIPLLLVPQVVARSTASRLDPYWEIEARLVEEFAPLHLFDPRPLLAIHPPEALLLDSNHMTREAHVWLAEALLAPITALLPLSPGANVDSAAP
jgi:lysophospholipase L1-like esterase